MVVIKLTLIINPDIVTYSWKVQLQLPPLPFTALNIWKVSMKTSFKKMRSEQRLWKVTRHLKSLFTRGTGKPEWDFAISTVSFNPPNADRLLWNFKGRWAEVYYPFFYFSYFEKNLQATGIKRAGSGEGLWADITDPTLAADLILTVRESADRLGTELDSFKRYQLIYVGNTQYLFTL